jgi:formamidase
VQTGQTAVASLTVSSFTDGTLDPQHPMLGPITDGGRIVASTAPGCWGPMITPVIHGAHEVTRPVAVEGAHVGGAVAIRIVSIEVHSLATASGESEVVDACSGQDPNVLSRCSGCGAESPETHLEGVGPEAVRCDLCGAPASPFAVRHGYTIVFDHERHVGVTVAREAAEQIGADPNRYAGIPANSRQNSVLALAPHDLVGAVARLRPFVGQLGTTPSIRIPDSHNAGDFGTALLGQAHEYGLDEAQLAQRTDGHMDIDAVRQGAIVVCPVKVEGAGVYVGDMHAMQGDGEIAGHTTDVAGEITLDIEVLPDVSIHGPVIFPLLDDLPRLARPLSSAERESVHALARSWNVEPEEALPISVVGTGANLNLATENGLDRAARLLGMSVSEVRNRATIAGAIEIGRHPGVIQVTFLAPTSALERAGLLRLAERQYAGGASE